MYIYIHTCAFTREHKCMHAHNNAYKHTSTLTYMHTTNAYIHTHTQPQNSLPATPSAATCTDAYKHTCTHSIQTHTHAHTTAELSPFYSVSPDTHTCIVHMTPKGVLTSPAYLKWVARFPATASTLSHIVMCGNSFAPQRPLHCASERYIRLLHNIHPSAFPVSTSPYDVLARDGPILRGTAAPDPHTLVAGGRAVAAYPTLRYILLPHKQPGLATDLVETQLMHRWGCVCVYIYIYQLFFRS